MVNDVEFLINFARTLDAVNRLTAGDKIKYFASLLINDYVLNKSPYRSDIFDECIDALNTLSNREIRLLLRYYYCEGRAKEFLEKSDSELKEATKTKDLLLDDYLREGGNPEEIEILTPLLLRSGFLRQITGAYYNYRGNAYHTTKALEEFVNMIEQP